MTTPTQSPPSPAVPEPVFGEWLRGIYASESNPHRDGMYVRTILRHGKFNHGKWYECTDGKGAFWQYPMESVERIAQPSAAPPPSPTASVDVGALRELVAKWRGSNEGAVALDKATGTTRFSDCVAGMSKCADELESILAQQPAPAKGASNG